jgi:hypothetical protein
LLPAVPESEPFLSPAAVPFARQTNDQEARSSGEKKTHSQDHAEGRGYAMEVE